MAKNSSGVPHPFLTFIKFYVTRIVKYACNRRERSTRLALGFPKHCHLSATGGFQKSYRSCKNVTTNGCGSRGLGGLTPWSLVILKQRFLRFLCPSTMANPTPTAPESPTPTVFDTPRQQRATSDDVSTTATEETPPVAVVVGASVRQAFQTPSTLVHSPSAASSITEGTREYTKDALTAARAAAANAISKILHHSYHLIS